MPQAHPRAGLAPWVTHAPRGPAAARCPGPSPPDGAAAVTMLPAPARPISGGSGLGAPAPCGHRCALPPALALALDWPQVWPPAEPPQFCPPCPVPAPKDQQGAAARRPSAGRLEGPREGPSEPDFLPLPLPLQKLLRAGDLSEITKTVLGAAAQPFALRARSPSSVRGQGFQATTASLKVFSSTGSRGRDVTVPSRLLTHSLADSCMWCHPGLVSVAPRGCGV